MKTIINFAIIFLAVSCKKESDLKITLLNNDIHSLISYKFKDDYYKTNYDSLSKNIIKYSIKNNSSKKYFIVFDCNSFETIEKHADINGNSIENNKLGISFNLYKNGKLNNGKYISNNINYDNTNANEYYTNPRNRYWISQDYDIEVFKRKELLSKDENISARQAKLIKNSFILYPNQVKYFTTVVNLPIRAPSEGVNWISKIDSTKKYDSNIILRSSIDEIKKYLTEDLKKEIQENGYEIFDGVTESNKVPVKVISMPKD